MLAAILDHVSNPVSGFLTAVQRFVPSDHRQPVNVCPIGDVLDEFDDVVVQFVRGEGQQVEAETDASVLSSTTIPALFGEHGNAEHRNAVVDSFVLAVRTAVCHEQFGLRVAKQVVLWQPFDQMNIVGNLANTKTNRHHNSLL